MSNANTINCQTSFFFPMWTAFILLGDYLKFLSLCKASNLIVKNCLNNFFFLKNLPVTHL